MPENIKNKRNFIISLFYIVCLVAIFYLFFKYAFWLLSPFLIAILAAILLQRPVNFLNRKTHLKRGIVSAVLVLLVIAAIGVLLGLVVSKLVGEIREFFNYIIEQLKSGEALVVDVTGWISKRLSFLPKGVLSSLNDKLGEIIRAVASIVSSESQAQVAGAAGEAENVAAGPGLSGLTGLFSGAGLSFSSILSSGSLGSVLSVIKQVPTVAVSILVAVICCIFMTSDYKTLRKLIIGIAGRHSDGLIKTKQVVFDTLGKYVKTYSKIILISFTELFIGLYLLKWIGAYKGKYIVVIALITALIDVIPVLGTGTVLIPWALWQLLISHNIGMGIGLLVIYVMITVIRQIIEPKLVGDELGLPSFVTLIAMYLGSQLFGFLGLFLLPLTLAVLMALNEDGVINILPKKIMEPETHNETFMLKMIDKAKEKKKEVKKS
ncbi:MAG: AI-2E family transporter [Clostridia bacterium]|nr:AI-2E family transporter [Clostridia bacterium]